MVENIVVMFGLTSHKRALKFHVNDCFVYGKFELYDSVNYPEVF